MLVTVVIRSVTPTYLIYFPHWKELRFCFGAILIT